MPLFTSRQKFSGDRPSFPAINSASTVKPSLEWLTVAELCWSMRTNPRSDRDRQLVVPLGSRPGCRRPLASRPDLAFMARDAQLEAVSDPVRPLDEVVGGRRRTDIAGGRGKDLEPAVEMRRVNRQRQMRGHRLTMIDPMGVR